MTPTDHQFKAIKEVRNWFSSTILTGGEAPHYYLGGFAGTGKTSIIPPLLDSLGLTWSDVAFVAPTGKAAKVLSGKLQGFFETREAAARTIHSAIYRPKPDRPEVLQRKIEDTNAAIGALREQGHDGSSTAIKDLLKTKEILEKDLEKSFLRTEGPSFQLNVDSLIREKKLIVCDEASMVGETIAEDLTSFDVPVLAIGDPFQLPPVGDVPGLTVGKPDSFLTEIHRQAADNPIIRLSMDVREGNLPSYGSMGDAVRIVRKKDDDATLADRDLQVLCGTHRMRWKVTSKIRKAYGFDSDAPMSGEPLIVCKNSRRIPDLVNGSFVVSVDDCSRLTEGDTAFPITVEDEYGAQRKVIAVQALFEEHKLKQKGGFTGDKREVYTSRRENEHLDWGWAITVHKSQGSQWDEVVLHNEMGSFREDAFKWLYTGLTRAAERLTIVQ